MNKFIDKYRTVHQKLKAKIYDNHGRPITYLRLSVTDRCNLRCFYCMPEEGITYLPKKHLLSYEEMERITMVLAQMGIHKIRITGGEPFVRKDLMPFLERLKQIEGIEEIHLTTNGVLTTPYIADLKKVISSVNLSLDTLDRERFQKITRRDDFEKVMTCFHELLAHQIPTKINAVTMANQNTEDILPLAELAKSHPVSVRYIEEMPFNGVGLRDQKLWSYRDILAELKSAYPDLQPLENEAHATATLYQVPNFQGNLGIIPAFSRTFCGSCNRIRITAQGTLKTCLYDDGVLDLKSLLRHGTSDEELESTFQDIFNKRPKDGFEAEEKRFQQIPVSESMSTIGG